MTDVSMSATSQHGDSALLKAIRVGLANAREAGVGDDHGRAVLIADVLDAYGLVLPPGVTIRGVATGGRTAWQVRGDGVEVTAGPKPPADTTWVETTERGAT